MTVTDEALADQFSTHRAHLIGVAYRLTGTLADAEDAVQESWLRLSTLDGTKRGAIAELRGWLTTVVSRICLDRLRSASARRESYVGPWLPEPVITTFGPQAGEDPLDAVVRDDGVRMAAMVVLERLTPEQRLAFVLHDAFAVPFGEIATILACTEATARQYASRGRRTASEADPPSRTALAEQGEVIERFVAAIAAGDLEALCAVLHPDAVLIGDGGGKARTTRNRITGPDKIARFFLGLAKQYGMEAVLQGRPTMVNGDLGIFTPDVPGDDTHRALSRRVTSFAMKDGKVFQIFDIVNPDKLERVQITD